MTELALTAAIGVDYLLECLLSDSARFIVLVLKWLSLYSLNGFLSLLINFGLTAFVECCTQSTELITQVWCP